MGYLVIPYTRLPTSINIVIRDRLQDSNLSQSTIIYYILLYFTKSAKSY